MTWPDFRKVLSSSQILRTKNMSWENLSTMIHRNQAIFYALILSPTIHFVLALISRGAEGTWRFAGSSRHGRVKLQTPLWFTKPELVMMWKKREMVLDCAWEWLGTWNQFAFLVACKCLQSQLQVLLWTILRWYLCHDLGILFLASICFSSFLFFWRLMSSVNWLHSSYLLEWIEEN